MKRTKDGGAILTHENGEETRITHAEFLQGRFIRDIIRIGIIIFSGLIDLIFIKNGAVVIIMMLIMLGWRFRTGW